MHDAYKRLTSLIVNHASIYENSELNVLRKYKFVGEISND